MARLATFILVLSIGCPAAAWAQDSAGKEASPFKAPLPSSDAPAQDAVSSINPLRDVTPLALAPSRPERPRFIAWASAEYILGTMSRSGVPALVTTSTSGTAQADAGVLNLPGTSMLLGPGSFGATISNGAQFGFGIRVVENVDVEVSGLFLLNAPTRFLASSTDTAIIARPFFEPITGQEASLLVAYPGRFDGSIDISTRTTLWGIDANVFEKFDLGIPLTLGIGLRYLNLSDNLQFQQNTTALGAPALTFNGAAIPLADSVQLQDSFHTSSEFIGPQLALKYGESLGRWSFDFYGKLALGSTARTLVVAGQSNHVSSSGQVVDVANGGFLATPTNSGTFVGSSLGVVPEINLKLGYQLRSNVKLFVAYDFLCWTNVARANDQIDHAVNLTQVPTAAVFNPAFGGPSNPAQLFRASDLTVHSLRAGLEWRF